MGGGPSISYCVPVTQPAKNESPVYRFPDFKDKLLDHLPEYGKTLKEVMIHSGKAFGHLPAIGRIVKKGEANDIQLVNYKQAVNFGHQIGSAIISEKLYNTPEGEKMKMIGIFSKNKPEWTYTDIGACLFGLTTIPIYDTLGDENITYVFKHTQITTCFVNDGALKSLTKCHDLVNVKALVCYDAINEDLRGFFNERGVNLIPFQELLQKGKDNLIDYNKEEFKVAPEDCITFSYTSGTTGPPKGAMISHRNFTSFIAAVKVNKDTKFCSDDVGLSYLPLPHILEREFVYSLLAVGARVVFFSGDVQKLKDDLAIVKPTVFVSVPRLFSRFHDVLKARFKEVTGFTKTALDYALGVKLSNLEKSGKCTHSIYDRIFFAKTKDALGGRVRLMISGSAPLLPEVQNFLKVCMCAPLIEGYGQTESTGAMTITDADDPVVRHVGGPTANIQLKLVDIPEMNYLSTDKDEEGRPTPRGQIWARGPAVFLGYYHDEAKTKETVTEDGWLKTGDVGALSAKTRGLSIVDRKKNIFKLQQGEYVAAEKVENCYLKGDRLAEIFIHGQSTETFVLAIAVPHHKALKEFAESKGIQSSVEQLCKNDTIRAEMVGYLNKIGKEAGLQGFEQAKNIYLEHEPFLSRGILTNTMKIQRHEAKKFYRPVIDQMYKEGMLKIPK